MQDSALEFPCDFPIKVLGRSATDFQQLVVSIVERHVPDLELDRLRNKTSRNGRYQSVTVTIRATSRAQLDAIYTDLSSHARVVMAL